MPRSYFKAGMKLMGCVLLIGVLSSAGAAAGTKNLKSFDGYRLDYEIDYPAGKTDKDVSRVAVLIHGSGPQDMREDLSAVSAPGTKNYFFTDLSGVLAEKGFAVIRYNKRAYQINEEVRKDKAFLKTSAFRKYSQRILDATIKDAEVFTRFALKTFPKAKVYLIGHSEGAYVGLQVADANKRVAGLALIGFSAQGREMLVFEQVVQRPLAIFDPLDTDRNGSLTAEELKKEDPYAKSLAGQMKIIDLDGNGILERAEFMGANLSNILLDTPNAMEWRQQEAERKKPANIIRDSPLDIYFFQGELDNQTPAYNAKAVQLANAMSWKKNNLHFSFFEGLGHALDKRTGYLDMVFKPADKQALQKLASDLDAGWE